MVTPARDDPRPSPLIGNWTTAARHEARVRWPAVRRGWLEDGPGPTDRRGKDEFVRLPWDEALDLTAHEVRDQLAKALA